MSRWIFPLLLLASTASAANLRDVKDPAKIKDVFPPAAKLRVVNVWATWCVPCVHEMDDLRAVSETFGAKDVDFVGVSMDDVLPGDGKAARAKVSISRSSETKSGSGA